MVDLGEVGPVLPCCGSYPWHRADCPIVSALIETHGGTLSAENAEAIKARFLAAQNERPIILPPEPDELWITTESIGTRWPPLQVVGGILITLGSWALLLLGWPLGLDQLPWATIRDVAAAIGILAAVPVLLMVVSWIIIGRIISAADRTPRTTEEGWRWRERRARNRWHRPRT